MDSNEYEQIQAIATEPTWKNTATHCTYISAIGIELGYIHLGEGSARGMWFAFITGREDALGPCTYNREQAKEQVESALDIESAFLTIPEFFEMPEFPDES